MLVPMEKQPYRHGIIKFYYNIENFSFQYTKSKKTAFFARAAGRNYLLFAYLAAAYLTAFFYQLLVLKMKFLVNRAAGERNCIPAALLDAPLIRLWTQPVKQIPANLFPGRAPLVY